MQSNYLIPSVGGPRIKMPSTAALRDKWTGAMIDSTGCAYAGALRLDFSPGCVKERAINAVADTLARYPILSAQFKIEDDILVGYAPEESNLREVLREQLRIEHAGISDKIFLDYRASQAFESGLRLGSSEDDSGLHVWIGFWTYTCDGTSIDLLTEEIAHRYLGKSISPSRSWAEYAEKENSQALERKEDPRHRIDAYPVPGPYGLDAIRVTPRGYVGHMKSVRFKLDVPRLTVAKSARACRVTPFVLMFSVFQRAVNSVSGVETVVTGVPFINRRRFEDNSVVGPISNTVPVTTCHKPDKPFTEEVKEIQHAVLRAADRQNIEPSALYPDGISPRNVNYELPFPQLFNAWNSQNENSKIALGEKEWMALHLLPNGTCRAGFEITLDNHSEFISGRIDMDADAYGNYTEQVIERIRIDLDSHCVSLHNDI